ncbi:hypothetical protein [Haloarcula marismortui]|uniref:DUF7964 domain-containing protein n=2 Tax=Haloarcula marismortui ATCC 33800 TaxID=662476 RepID=M0JKE5_9EURY|nr:hypothetical protein [Haloarcula sinaiiensis]EMA08165.1 hypothetical protein C436_20568 [Haloarcula sinaiiensis ATCC 33800]
MVSSLPDRPLSKAEVVSDTDRFREFLIDPDAEEAFAISLLGDEEVHALGFVEEDSEWVRFYSENVSNTSDEAMDQFEEEIFEWGKENYGDRIDSGELKFVDTQSDDEDTERVPPEVEAGLEPEYDCPNCDYYKTGVTTGPQSFLEHLQEAHDYDQSEAHSILNS